VAEASNALGFYDQATALDGAGQQRAARSVGIDHAVRAESIRPKAIRSARVRTWATAPGLRCRRRQRTVYVRARHRRAWRCSCSIASTAATESRSSSRTSRSGSTSSIAKRACAQTILIYAAIVACIAVVSHRCHRAQSGRSGRAAHRRDGGDRFGKTGIAVCTGNAAMRSDASRPIRCDLDRLQDAFARERQFISDARTSSRPR